MYFNKRFLEQAKFGKPFALWLRLLALLRIYRRVELASSDGYMDVIVTRSSSMYVMNWLPTPIQIKLASPANGGNEEGR